MKERNSLLDTLTLKKHYQSLLRELKLKSVSTDYPNEILHHIFTFNTIKTFLIGELDKKRILIQIEITPTEFPPLEDGNHCLKESNREITYDLCGILEDQISNLRYLSVLNEKGFTLSCVAEECIWYATKVLESEPTEELFNLLKPLLESPSQKSKHKTKVDEEIETSSNSERSSNT